MTEFRRRRSKPLRFQAVPLDEEHPNWLDLDRQLPADHLARRIRCLVDSLDLALLLETYTGVGGPILPPPLLLAFVLFELQRKRTSPAQWYLDSRESLPARWLLRGLTPSRAVCYRFREHLPPELLTSLNRSVLLLARAEGHTSADNAALDGTFTAAHGSRHRLLNDQRLSQRLQRLDLAITRDDPRAAPSRVEAAPDHHRPEPTADSSGAQSSSVAQPATTLVPSAVFAQAETAVTRPLPAEGRPYWMASTKGGRLRQRVRYQRAQQILQQRLRERDHKQKGKSQARRKKAAALVLCPTEPEAVLGKDKLKVFRPLYNTQIMQDVESPFVLGYGVYAQVSDSGLLPPLLQRTEQLTGCPIRTLRTDGIYATLRDVRYCKDNGVQLYAAVTAGGSQSQENSGQDKAKAAGQGGKGRHAAAKAKKYGKEQFHWQEPERTYRCPAGHLLQLGRLRSRDRDQGAVQVEEYRCPKEHCLKCPQASRCTSSPEQGRTLERMVGQELLDELAARLRTAEGQNEYKKRRQTVELRHGDMRTHRGLHKFHGYGRRPAESQVGLLVLAHNGLTLLQARAQRQAEQRTMAAAPKAELASRTQPPTTKPTPDLPRPTATRMSQLHKQTDDPAWLSYN